MATIGLFLAPTQVIATAYLDENIDQKYLTNAISIAQDMHILRMLGTGIYDELRSQITGNTVTVLNATLLGTYIEPALTWWTLFELIEPLNYKFTNKAIVKKNSENSNPIGVQEMTNLKDKFKNMAEWYTERMRKYLVENQSSYPLYYNPGNGVDTVHPSNESYSTGWFLGRSNERGTNNENNIINAAENPGTYEC